MKISLYKLSIDCISTCRSTRILPGFSWLPVSTYPSISLKLTLFFKRNMDSVILAAKTKSICLFTSIDKRYNLEQKYCAIPAPIYGKHICEWTRKRGWIVKRYGIDNFNLCQRCEQRGVLFLIAQLLESVVENRYMWLTERGEESGRTLPPYFIWRRVI